jgi:predicted Zn finger-like uncharacterized protein
MQGGSMNVVCPTCNTNYTIRDNKIPRKKSIAKCKKCGGKILVGGVTPIQASPASVSATPCQPYPHTPTSSTNKESTRLVMLEDYPELQSMDPLKFDFQEILSPNKKGRYKSRQNNFKLKILRAVHQMLGKILKDGEKVMRIAKATAYYPAEILFGNGYLTMMYNHYAIICTNQRLLFININSRINRPTHYLFQMVYEEIKKVKRGLSGILIIYRFKGKRRIFMSMKRYCSKELKHFIMDTRGSMKGEQYSTEPLENLCPSCFVPLKKGLISCPHCKVDFKEPKKAFFKSLTVPGWGDIYLGHRALGTLELIASAVVWLTAVSLFLSEAKEAALVLLLLYNGVDGLLTYHMAKKGYMLAGN